jgi:anti-anti-sigma factor
MEMIEDIIDGKTIITLSGRIDSTSSNEFEEKLVSIIDAGTTKMVVDFLNVQFISSAGLRVLLLAAKKVKPNGGKVILSNLSTSVKEVFDISGFSSLFTICASVQEAIDSLK